MNRAASLLLASASPRRQLLLADAGIDVHVHPPDVDDGTLHSGLVPPGHWVMALAYLKARRVQQLRCRESSELILGADTVCVHRGRILGQPADAEQARWMLRSMCNARHETITGVCLLREDRRLLFVDRAVVHIGDVPEAELEQYIESQRWRGKAGGYNLAEQLEAGWPIHYEGDPATVMGLPMQRLSPMLRDMRL